jgi:superfamily II DNA helicase RecQ
VSAVAILKATEMSTEEIAKLEQGDYNIVFVSPESLMQKRWLQLVKKFMGQITCVACDEVHCLIQWGETFRQTYKQVSLLRSFLTEVPFLLLTATCTETMHRQICQHLLLSESEIFTTAILPDRPNVFLHFHPNVKHFQIELKWLLDHLRQDSVDKVIVFCRYGEHVQNIYAWLCANLGYNSAIPLQNRSVTMYHGSITHDHESEVARDFPRPESQLRCIIATIAFGMGVDIPDIRYIVHWGVPKTPLNYWQEIG